MKNQGLYPLACQIFDGGLGKLHKATWLTYIPQDISVLPSSPGCIRQGITEPTRSPHGHQPTESYHALSERVSFVQWHQNSQSEGEHQVAMWIVGEILQTLAGPKLRR